MSPPLVASAVGNAAFARFAAQHPTSSRVVARDSFFHTLAQGAAATWRAGPVDALASRLDASTAADWADQYTDQGSVRGPNNALRHCLWAAMTMRNVLGIGRTDAAYVDAERQADGIVMAHEDYGEHRDVEDSAIDQHNNHVGFELIRTLGASHAPDIPDQAIYAAARTALEDGRLDMSDPTTGRRVSTQDWRRFVRSRDHDPWAHYLGEDPLDRAMHQRRAFEQGAWF